MMKSFSDLIHDIYMYFPLQIRERCLNDDPTTETDEILYQDANLVSNSI